MTGSKPFRLAMIIAAASAALRLMLAAVTPILPDETYYWEWSRRLAGGYYDHPPMIALFIRAGTAVFGVSAFGIRVVPVLAGFGAVLAAIALARRVGGDEAALRASIVLACLPLAGAGLVLATPDGALLLFTGLALLAIERAVRTGTSSRAALGAWALAGIWSGAAMSSKYTGILLPASLVVALAVVPSLRRQFATPGPYVAVVLASAVMLPVLLWNAQHDWASFRFQLAHGFTPSRGRGIAREFELLAGQLGIVTPILFVMFAIVVGRGLRAANDAVTRMLAIVATLTFLFFAYSAWKRTAEANWPAPSYIPAIALFASYAGTLAWERWFAAGWKLAAALLAFTYVWSVFPIVPLPARQDPMARGAGFRALTARVTQVRDSLQPGRGTIHIAGQKYQDASELAYWMPGHPGILSFNNGYPRNQYDYWPDLGAIAMPGSSLLLVGPADADSTLTTNHGLAALTPFYKHVTLIDVVALRRGESVRERKRIWFLDSLQSATP
jgi:4-amino-4-deoxy-L-arabinose transferase-like glycosyltransferase